MASSMPGSVSMIIFCGMFSSLSHYIHSRSSTEDLLETHIAN